MLEGWRFREESQITSVGWIYDTRAEMCWFGSNTSHAVGEHL